MWIVPCSGVPSRDVPVRNVLSRSTVRSTFTSTDWCVIGSSALETREASSPLAPFTTPLTERRGGGGPAAGKSRSFTYAQFGANPVKIFVVSRWQPSAIACTFGSGFSSASRQAAAPAVNTNRSSTAARRFTRALSPPASLRSFHDRGPPRPGRVLCRRRGAGGPRAPPRPPRRRGRPERPRRRRDGELRRARLRDPVGDGGGRGTPPLPACGLPAPAARALPRLLARGVVDDPRDRADSRAGRHRRGLPRPRRGRAVVRRRARTRGGGARGGACADAPVVLTRRRDIEGGRQDRLRPAQARRPDRRAPRPRSGVPGALPDPHPPRPRPACRGAPPRDRDRDDR